MIIIDNKYHFVDKEILNYINNVILPQYDSNLYDKGHRRDHINQVISESMRLSKFYDVDKNMMFVIAAYHDLGIRLGRKDHHISGRKLLLNDEFLKSKFSKSQLKIMGDAIEDHRASSGSEPRTIYGKIVSDADRNIDSRSTISRILKYGMDNYSDKSFEFQRNKCIEHLREKYGDNGYLKLYLPESKGYKELVELRKLIRNENKLNKVISEVYNSLWK